MGQKDKGKKEKKKPKKDKIDKKVPPAPRATPEPKGDQRPKQGQ